MGSVPNPERGTATWCEDETGNISHWLTNRDLPLEHIRDPLHFKSQGKKTKFSTKMYLRQMIFYTSKPKRVNGTKYHSL